MLRPAAFAVLAAFVASCSLIAPPRSDFEGGESPGADAGAGPVTIYSGAAEVTGLAAAGGTVYLAMKEAGAGRVAAWRTGSALRSVATELIAPSSVDLDGSNVYWTDGAPAGEVARASRSELGQPITIDQPSPRSLLLAAGQVHWISGQSIVAAAADLTNVRVVASAQAGPTALAFASGVLFWIAVDTGEIWSRNLAGGGARPHEGARGSGRAQPRSPHATGRSTSPAPGRSGASRPTGAGSTCSRSRQGEPW